MVVDKVFSVAAVDGPFGNVEWLGDSRALHHVCNDMSLKWDIKVRDDPIMHTHLSREL